MSRVVELNDVELIKLVKSENDSNAWEVLDRRYRDSVFTYVAKRGGKDRAEEITQKVFYDLYLNIDKYDESKGNLKNYLFMYATKYLYDGFNKEKREAPIDAIAEKFDESDFEKNFFIKEKKKIVHSILRKLEEKELLGIIYHYFEELSDDEVSNLTDDSKSNVRVKRFRALEKIRKLLGRK